MKRTGGVLVVTALVGVGCGGGEDNQRDGGTGGVLAHGGATTGGAEEGGSPGVGGTRSEGGTDATSGGNDLPAGACTPVQRVNPPSHVCSGWNTRPVGIPLDDPNVSVTSVVLPTLMVSGSEYALSLVTVAGEAEVQLWGTNEDCGPSLEALGANTTTRLEPGVQCWNFIPNSMHSHLLVIRRVEEGYVSGDLQVCALGGC